MKIYTKTGDSGETSLFGAGRVTKSHPRIEAYGTVDEANAALGMARAHASEHEALSSLEQLLERIQAELFVLGADLATPEDGPYPVPRVEPEHIDGLEQAIDTYEAKLPALKHFVLPAGTLAASAFHVARTVTRRAERSTVHLAVVEQINENVVKYLNRLSDLLFVLARFANHAAGVGDVEWIPVKSA
ncbi:MAG: cob(I)yrinic acid a,c-diamide adenosyltransferase [Bacteroidota bacterium]